jgi:hypothetical protein
VDSSDITRLSIEELAERLAQEAESGAALAGTVPEAVDGLIGAGLAHRVSKELVAASWRGMRGKAAADSGERGALQVSETGGVGVFVDSSDDGELIGGAEGLSGRLDPLSARD